MNIEAGNLQENERVKKKLSERDEIIKVRERIALDMKKESLRNTEQADKHLNLLKNLLDDGKLDSNISQLVDEVTRGSEISQDEIQKIFKIIDDTNNNDAINKYLSPGMIISKDEYKKAIIDDVFRGKILAKISSILTLLEQHIHSDSGLGLNVFTGFIAVLDKNLIIIQENHIDMQNTLKRLNPIEKKGFLGKLISVVKEY